MTIKEFLKKAKQGDKVKVKLGAIDPMEFKGSLLKENDILEAYVGHDGTGKPCLRIVEISVSTTHWIITDQHAVII